MVLTAMLGYHGNRVFTIATNEFIVKFDFLNDLGYNISQKQNVSPLKVHHMTTAAVMCDTCHAVSDTTVVFQFHKILPPMCCNTAIG